MEKLSVLRERGEGLYKADRQVRSLTIEESLHHWVELQTAFEWQLQQTASLFEQDRRSAMIALQARLHRLID